MPRIPISDVLGIDVNGGLTPNAKLTQLLPALTKFKDATLDQVPLGQAQADLNFDRPIDIAGVSLRIGASGGGAVALIFPNQRSIDEGDPFNLIAVNADEIYTAMGFSFSENAGVSVSVAPATFGLSVHGGLEIKCYRRFKKGTSGFPTFAKALGTAASSFLFPQRAADLDDLDADTVVVIAGNGSLTASGGFTISAPAQALASVGPIAGQSLDVSAHGSFGVSATITISGGYQLRLRRVAARVVEIGVYTVKSREAGLRVSAEVGVSATAGKFDLAEPFIKALSRQPAVDAQEFRKALPGEDGPSKERQIDGFQSSLKNAIGTNLQASVSAKFSSLGSDEAAWIFEIDLDAAKSDQAIGAITSAMGGDFTALTADPNALPAGIAQKENVFTRTDLRTQTLNVNLLGILNTLSVAKVVRVSTIERNASGAITLITDTSSASRLEALLLNAGVDAKRLRRMLSENFLIEAAYHATNLGVLPPEFRSRHTYFEVHSSTGKQEMKDNLDVARVLALISPEEENRRLARNQFGRTTFYTEIRYTSETVRRLFLDSNGAPRSVEDYENAGRSALGALLQGDPGQEFRQRYADLGLQGTDLWNKMKSIGNVASFGPLFGIPVSATDPRVAAAGSDFITITDWASAMNEAAAGVREVEDLLAGNRLAPDDPRLSAARDRLKQRLAGAVSRAHEHFGDPLGLVMVYVAAGQEGEKRVIVTGDEIERLEVSSQPAVSVSQGATNAGKS